MSQGDLTRGVLSRGKKADGRSENDGYKFVSFAYDVILVRIDRLADYASLEG